MDADKKNQQNNTESEEYKRRLNWGAEKEKQILNQIRQERPRGYDSMMHTQLGGGMFEFAYKKN